jgi:multiple sugar transport system substrate-binding protein
LLRQQLKAFEALHRSVQVRLLHYPQQYNQALQFRLASGQQPPNVALINSLSYQQLAERGYLRPLPLPPKGSTQPQALQAFTQQGHLWAWPRDVSTLVVYANTQLLQQAGVALPSFHWRWPQAVALMRTVRQRLGAQGLNVPWGFSLYYGPSLFWLPFYWSEGGSAFWRQRNLQVFFSEAPSNPGLALYQALAKEGFAPTHLQTGQQTMSELFLQGKLLFWLSGRWSLPLLAQQASFSWQALPFPSGSHGSRVGVDASGYVLFKAAPHPKESMALLQFLTSPTVQQQLASSGLILPASTAVPWPISVEGRALHPSVNASFNYALAQGVASHVPAQWPRLSPVLEQSLGPVWEGSRLLPQALATQEVQGAVNPL